MLRTPASRSILSNLAGWRAQHPPLRPVSARSLQLTARVSSTTLQRPRLALQAFQKPVTTLIVRQATTSSSSSSSGAGWSIDKKAEARYGEHKLEVHPDLVSATSSVHPVFGEIGVKDNHEKDVDMSASIKADLRTIKETFDLSEVPRQAYYMGLAGVLPYLATSLGTVGCAYEINHAHATGTGYLMSQHTAEALLHLLEPLQIGYGAVIISFLGAIHWGLEWAGYGGYHGYRRYAIGVVAPAVAWPTLLLSPTYALISQFFAFNFLYYADARATTRGWAPPWYSTYRFVLTFIVGASIVVSLIGRSEIADKVRPVKSPVDHVRGMADDFEQRFRDEEAARAARFAALGGDDSEEAEEGEGEGEDADEKEASSSSGEDKAGDEGGKQSDAEGEREDGDEKK